MTLENFTSSLTFKANTLAFWVKFQIPWLLRFFRKVYLEKYYHERKLSTFSVSLFLNEPGETDEDIT